MEFNQKLHRLRKDKNLTQEELARALFVSRTAVSKWESGRGLPSIDLLKEIAKFFSVTVDELISGEKIISLAQKEAKTKLKNLCDLFFGFADLLCILLIVLPLYPLMQGGYVYSVCLFDGAQISTSILVVCWIGYSILILLGIAKIVLKRLKVDAGRKAIFSLSLTIGVILVLFLAVARLVYGVVVAFVLLAIKCVLMFKYSV